MMKFLSLILLSLFSLSLLAQEEKAKVEIIVLAKDEVPTLKDVKDKLTKLEKLDQRLGENTENLVLDGAQFFAGRHFWNQGFRDARKIAEKQNLISDKKGSRIDGIKLKLNGQKILSRLSSAAGGYAAVKAIWDLYSGLFNDRPEINEKQDAAFYDLNRTVTIMDVYEKSLEKNEKKKSGSNTSEH